MANLIADFYKAPFCFLDDVTRNGCRGYCWAEGWQEKLTDDVAVRGDAATSEVTEALAWIWKMEPRKLAQSMLEDMYFVVHLELFVRCVMSVCVGHVSVQTAGERVFACINAALDLLAPDVVESIRSADPDAKVAEVRLCGDVWK